MAQTVAEGDPLARDRRKGQRGMTKQCTSCEQWKPLGDFYANGSRPGYTWPTCKACKRAERAAYREAHREAINAGKVEHHRRNPHLKWRYRYEERMREAGMLALVEHFTRDDVVARYGDACFHCGGDFEELDHFPVPVRDGGPHTLANVRPSCRACNRKTWRRTA